MQRKPGRNDKGRRGFDIRWGGVHETVLWEKKSEKGRGEGGRDSTIQTKRIIASEDVGPQLSNR